MPYFECIDNKPHPNQDHMNGDFTQELTIGKIYEGELDSPGIYQSITVKNDKGWQTHANIKRFRERFDTIEIKPTVFKPIDPFNLEI